MPTQRRLATFLAVAFALVAGLAPAASLRLSSGASLTAMAAGQLVLPGPLGGPSNAVSGSFGGGIAYVMTEPGGRVWTGTVPGTRGASVGEPSLAQNPITGDVFLVFARLGLQGADLAFSSWTGQSWTDPLALTTAGVSVEQPALSFGETGEAVLAWRQNGAFPALLVRHFELSPSGPFQNHAFLDLGVPASLTRPAGGPIGLPTGVASVTVDSVTRRAYLLVVDAETEAVGLVRLDLQALYQGGGFNAPPVPVSLARATTQSSASEPLVERPSEQGAVLAPWRLSLTADSFAYYWMESNRIAFVVFRAGSPSSLLTSPLPADEAQFHAAAYRAVLREIGFVDRRGADRQVLRRR